MKIRAGPPPFVQNIFNNLSAAKSDGLLVKLARARWRVEMDYRELKEELGLDHYEGRHWLGWHHHITLVSMAFPFYAVSKPRPKKNFWCDVDHAASDASTASSSVDTPRGTVPVVQNTL